MRWLIPLLLVLTGCRFVPGTDANAMKGAEQAIAATLYDPGSAEFRNERVAQPGLVCGEVNAKNQFGGYVGFRAFGYASDQRDLYIANDGYEPSETVCVAGLCCNGMNFNGIVRFWTMETTILDLIVKFHVVNAS